MNKLSQLIERGYTLSHHNRFIYLRKEGRTFQFDTYPEGGRVDLVAGLTVLIDQAYHREFGALVACIEEN
ncbi:MAG: hypothetical protein V3T23_12445 [Nitrososphaerales archaeon]